MALYLLGPLEVRVGARPVPITSRHQRALLAALALRPGETLSADRLIDALWGERPPPTAPKALQVQVSKLRRLLEAPVLTTGDGGYELRLPDEAVDAVRFERLLAQQRPREALALWRGDALGDLLPGPVLAAETSRLEDSRRGALEHRIEADLRLGRHRDLLGELKGLMIRYPVHEQFCVQLMLAAYRSGQRDEALAAYDRLRRVVVEHTGLEPSERLRRLHHDVLVDSPALTADVQAPAGPSPAPAEIPAAPEILVGRAHDLARIGAAVRRRPEAAAPGLAVLCGPPGAGKSATALFVAQRLRHRFPDGQLFAALHTRTGVPADPLDVLRDFLAAVGDEQPPTRLEAAARRFRSWTADRKALIVLDDAAGAEQVAPLLPNGRGCGTLVTSRGMLPGLSGAATVRLGPLDPGDAFQLLGLLVGEARVLKHPEAALELAELCDNLPLAIRVAAERLAARPLVGLPELAASLRMEETRLDELRVGGLDVGARMRDAVRRLERGDRQAVRRLAALGPAGFGLEQAAKALELDERPAQHAVNRLLECSMLEESGGDPDHEWPWAARRFRVPTLIRLAWTDVRGPEREQAHPGAAAEHRGRCRAGVPPQPFSMRLSRFHCMPVPGARHGS